MSLDFGCLIRGWSNIIEPVIVQVFADLCTGILYIVMYGMLSNMRSSCLLCFACFDGLSSQHGCGVHPSQAYHEVCAGCLPPSPMSCID